MRATRWSADSPGATLATPAVPTCWPEEQGSPEPARLLHLRGVGPTQWPSSELHFPARHFPSPPPPQPHCQLLEAGKFGAWNFCRVVCALCQSQKRYWAWGGGVRDFGASSLELCSKRTRNPAGVLTSWARGPPPGGPRVGEGDGARQEVLVPGRRRAAGGRQVVVPVLWALGSFQEEDLGERGVMRRMVRRPAPGLPSSFFPAQRTHFVVRER